MPIARSLLAHSVSVPHKSKSELWHIPQSAETLLELNNRQSPEISLQAFLRAFLFRRSFPLRKVGWGFSVRLRRIENQPCPQKMRARLGSYIHAPEIKLADLFGRVFVVTSQPPVSAKLLTAWCRRYSLGISLCSESCPSNMRQRYSLKYRIKTSPHSPERIPLMLCCFSCK